MLMLKKKVKSLNAEGRLGFARVLGIPTEFG